MERLKPPAIFSGTSSANALTTSEAKIPNCSADEALGRAMLLLGCYRKADCADPEVFATAAVAVLSHYPADVVLQVTDPHSGIAARSKWVPTISELREACDIVNNVAKRREEADARVKAQFSERERMAALPPAERRREFIAREMAWINSEMAKANPDKPAPALDIRGMEEGPRKRDIAAKLAAALDARARELAASPLRLSEQYFQAFSHA